MWVVRAGGGWGHGEGWGVGGELGCGGGSVRDTMWGAG